MQGDKFLGHLNFVFVLSMWALKVHDGKEEGQCEEK